METLFGGTQNKNTHTRCGSAISATNFTLVPDLRPRKKDVSLQSRVGPTCFENVFGFVFLQVGIAVFAAALDEFRTARTFPSP